MKQSESERNTLKRAIALQRAGRLEKATALFEKLLSREPQHRRVLHALVEIAVQAEQFARAEELLARLAALAPNDPELHLQLGKCQRRTGSDSDAVKSFQRAIRLQPDLAEAWFRLGALLRDMGELESAIVALERALDIEPGSFDFHSELARTLERAGDWDRARLEHRCAGLLGAGFDGSAGWLGHQQEAHTYREAGQLDFAVSCYHAALAVAPNQAVLFVQLSIVLREMGRLFGAILSARRAVGIESSSAVANTALAAALVDAMLIDEARSALSKALAADSRLADAHFHLGRAFFHMAEIDAAIASYRRALELNPNHRFSHSGLVFAMPYASGYSQQAIGAEASKWASQHMASRMERIGAHANDRSPTRVLRLAYASGDFRAHPMAHFVVPLLDHHDKSEFEVYCYSSVSQADTVTERIRSAASVYRDVSGRSDAALTAQIERDEVDILVDLSLHSGDQRLAVLAARPAPIQIVYLGYLGTTGLDSVQYRITAPYLDEPAVDGVDGYSEAPLSLPDAYWCYSPLDRDSDPDPATIPPAAGAGYFTFGSQNSFHKLSDEALQLWAKVLRAVPHSRFVMHAPSDGQHRVCTAFARYGVGRERLTFLPRRERAEYLASFNAIDLCLDTVPYNGATTTLDGFWMGTPTLTLVGMTPVGRVGRHICTNLDLPELIANTPDEFEYKAVEFARDLSRLAEIRAGLRARLRASPLMDAPRFVRNLEMAYRAAWQAWCTATPSLSRCGLPNRPVAGARN